MYLLTLQISTKKSTNKQYTKEVVITPVHIYAITLKLWDKAGSLKFIQGRLINAMQCCV